MWVLGPVGCGVSSVSGFVGAVTWITATNVAHMAPDTERYWESLRAAAVRYMTSGRERPVFDDDASV